MSDFDLNATIQSCPDEADHPFVMIPRELIRDPNLSPECKWFISYLLSHSTNFKIRIPYVIKSQKISKNRIYPIINEAIKAGYVKREEYFEGGMKRFRYFVSRKPKFKEILLCPQNQDTENQDPENEDSKLYQSKSSSEDLEKKEQYKEVPASPPSADAEALCEFFLKSLRERNPKFKEPNKLKWIKEFDLLLRVDGRQLDEVKSLISWASSHKWWKISCLSPANLRKNYDAMVIEIKFLKRKKS